MRVNWWINDSLLLDIIFLIVAIRFGIWEVKNWVLNWTSWPKCNIRVLLQGDERHPRDDQLVMALEALTGVNYLVGRPSWSIDVILRGEHHGDDMSVWRGQWRASPGWRVTRPTARMSVVRSVAYNWMLVPIFDVVMWLGYYLDTVLRYLMLFIMLC